MPTQWDQFEAVDEPKASTDWSQFEAVDSTPTDTRSPERDMPTAPDPYQPADIPRPMVDESGIPQRLSNEEWDRLRKKSELQDALGAERIGGELIDRSAKSIDQLQEGIVPANLIETGLAVGAPSLNSLSGVRRAVAEAGSGLTSPVNVGMMLGGAEAAAIPKIGTAVARGIAGGFTADIAQQMPELGTEAGKAFGVGTPEEAQKALAQIGLSAVMGGVAGAGVFHRIPRPAVELIKAAERTDALPKSVAALKETAAKTAAETKTQEVPSAVPIEKPNEEVLRQPSPTSEQQLGLQEVGARNAEAQVPAGAREPARAQAGAENEIPLNPAIDQFLSDVNAGRITSTQDAQAFGKTIRTPEEIARMKQEYERASAAGMKALKELPEDATPEQSQEAINAAYRPQMINEAIEQATGASAYKLKDAAKYRELMDAGQPAKPNAPAAPPEAQPLPEPAAQTANAGVEPAAASQALNAGALGESGMGAAKPGEAGKPTIGDVIPPRATAEPPGGAPPGAPPPPGPPTPPVPPPPPPPEPPTVKPRLQRFRDNLSGTLGTMVGQTLPKITRAARAAGELGARYISSRIAAPFEAKLFTRDVLAGLDIDPVRFGAALSEDNLRSIEGSTFSFVGEGKPFTTEAEYQAFLKDPVTREAIQRHIDNWNAVIEPQYREAMMIDPTEVLDTRGKQTGARVNLAAIVEDRPTPPGTPSGGGRGNLLNTLRRKSPFGVKAKGTGEAYASNYQEIIQNTFNKQLEIANKNAFDEGLVKAGLAVIDDPGKRPEIGGEKTVGFPLKRKTLITDNGVFSQNKTLYIKESLAREYRNAANVDENPYGHLALVKAANVANQAALAGLTDATVHLTNLSTGLMQVPASNLSLLADTLLSAAGRAELVPKAVSVIKKAGPGLLRNSKLLRAVTPDVILKGVEDAFWKNQTQLAELAQIGALKADYPGRSRVPLMGKMSDVIQWYDRTVRSVLDDSYKNLAEQGLVENTETARREFVNQVGQYNKRAQGALVRLSRDLGTGPFVTAGRAFNVLGGRAVALDPGVKASSPVNAALLRANAASKWLGTFAFVGLVNYLITGKMGGRPGTPIGSIDTGKNDDQGRMKSFSVVNLTGQGRGLRVTGLRGAIEAKQKGLPNEVALDAGGRDIINSAIAPFAGPVAKAGVEAATGYPTAINVGRATKVVPPGQSQVVENVKQAAEDINPIASGISKSLEPGKTGSEIWRTQLPRFTMQVKQPENMIANYPVIVRRAQANAYMEDVIHRARYIEDEKERRQYLLDSLAKLDPADRAHALLVLRFRKIKL